MRLRPKAKNKKKQKRSNRAVREQSYWHGSNRATITMWSGGKQAESPKARGTKPEGRCIARRDKKDAEDCYKRECLSRKGPRGTPGTRGGPEALLHSPPSEWERPRSHS
jgi:hypothetical protein